MKRADKDKYLGKATKATPEKSDQTMARTHEELRRFEHPIPTREEVKRLEAVLDLHKSLNKIGDLRLQRRQVERSIGQEISQAMARGATWQMIGDRLETTTQAAWSRYHQIRNPQDPRAANEVMTAGGGIADRGEVQGGVWIDGMDPELPLD